MNLLKQGKLVILLLGIAFLVMQGRLTVSAAPATSGIKGVNNPHIWFDSQAYAALDAIKSHGFNTVRVVWSTSGSGARLGEIISRCKTLGLKPILELHDVTGGNSGSEIDRMVNYWISVKSYLPSDVWINIANEWGPANSTVWRDAYLSGIKAMRNAGFSNTLVIDSGGWGQDDQDILDYGPAILAADANIVFSIHMYGSWNDNTKINSFLTSCQSKGLPIMVGEFGYNYNNGNNNLSCKVDAAYLVKTCNSKGIGYLAWSWYGNNAENAWLDLTTSDWKTLNTWGTLFKNAAFGGTTPSPSPSPSPSVTPSSGCAVSYTQNDWASGATVSVTIKNNGAAAINGWTLSWNYAGNQKITNLWNATYTQSGAGITIKNAAHNGTIPAGGTASFGFNISYSGSNAKPTDFTLNGTPCQVL